VPKVKVCIWNVQDYGTLAPDRLGRNGQIRNNFIATFLKHEEIDVLMMMEVRAGSNASLQNLLQALRKGISNDWAFSRCGSALTSAAPNPPRDPAELTYMTGARSEGYAVFWRTNHPRFQVLQGLNPISDRSEATRRNPRPPQGNAPLNLVTVGRLASKKIGDDYMVRGGYWPRDQMPRDEDQKLLATWPELEFPSTDDGNAQRLRMDKARRPAYVVLKLEPAGGAAAKLCPVAAYHAPSSRGQAAWGAFQAGLSRELYVTNAEGANLASDPAHLGYCSNTIFGGDFNYGPPKDVWPGEYRYFTQPFSKDPEGGAKCLAKPSELDKGPARKTTIQLLAKDHKTPITGRSIDDYLSLDIDYVFYRSEVATSRAERVNVPELFLQADGYKDCLWEVFQRLKRVERAIHGNSTRVDPVLGPQKRLRAKEPWRPVIAAPGSGSFVNYPSFKRQIQKGEFEKARQAAECFRLFVSDHLPLVMTLDF
jgi:hypothetical protein